ncbi:alcohol dehydrogenase GroES domain protein, partial [Hyaloraphidium curvatum]
MKALVYKSVGEPRLEDRPEPKLVSPTDAIVRITTTTICGTDLHILKGDVATCELGRTLGHEGAGVVEAVGDAVTSFKPGDRVLISCISSCGRCFYCRKGMYSHCESGGWILGHRIDSTQAEKVRIPHADTSLYRIPDGADEEALVMLSDILPTGYECGVLNGKVSPGSLVAVVGTGPVGLAAILTARFFSPAGIMAVDLDASRLEVAKNMGADWIAKPDEAKSMIKELSDGRGADTVIEAVGIPYTFELCQKMVAPGGTIANVGVHGQKVDLHLETLWAANISITTRLVDTETTAMLMKLVQSGKVDASRVITHRFKLADIEKAYETFGKAAESKALKVIVSNE